MINNVYHEQSLIGRLMRYGNVRLETAGEQGIFLFESRPPDMAGLKHDTFWPLRTRAAVLEWSEPARHRDLRKRGNSRGGPLLRGEDSKREDAKALRMLQDMCRSERTALSSLGVLVS